MLFGGEYDMHASNIGVMKAKNDKGEDIEVFAKIDHGWSASEFFTDHKVMMENLAEAYLKHGYKGKIDLNITKFREAVDEISKISDEEIATTIKMRTQKLKTMGFDIKGLLIPFWENDPKHDFDTNPPKSITFKDFDELENHYIKHYQAQRKSFQSLSKTLAIMEKIEHPLPNWKNGTWLINIQWLDLQKWHKINCVKFPDVAKQFAKNIKIAKESIVVQPSQGQSRNITLPPPPTFQILKINPPPPGAKEINLQSSSGIMPINSVVRNQAQQIGINVKIVLNQDGLLNKAVDNKFLLAARAFAKNVEKQQSDFDEDDWDDHSNSPKHTGLTKSDPPGIKKNQGKSSPSR